MKVMFLFLLAQTFFCISSEELNKELLEAAQKPDNYEVIGDLLAKGAQLSYKDSSGNTTLHYLAKSDSEEVIALLSKADFDPNVQNNSELTPLHWAIIYNSLSFAKMLYLKKKASLTIQDDLGRTPLDLAQTYSKDSCSRDFLACVVIEESDEFLDNQLLPKEMVTAYIESKREKPLL